MDVIGHQYITVNQAVITLGNDFELLEEISIVAWTKENHLAVVATDYDVLGQAAYIVARLSGQDAVVRWFFYSLLFWVVIEDVGNSKN